MSSRQSVQIPVQPWFRDHHFNGQTIFPAVESMLLLAGVAKELRPDIQINRMIEASFPKFLAIPEGATELSALVESETDENENRLCLRLLSKIQLKKISRIKEHAAICFPAQPVKIEAIPRFPATESEISITAERIYQELVPFGPTYRSLTETLQLSEKGACGNLQAPKLRSQHTMEKETGSPFPLDGAMHAACVLGQCIADFVPFPVGFQERFIHKPTQAGKQYSTTVILRAATKEDLLFDLSIFDTAGIPCETVRGLRMRDVSRGSVRPPADLPKLRVSPQSPD